MSPLGYPSRVRAARLKPARWSNTVSVLPTPHAYDEHVRDATLFYATAALIRNTKRPPADVRLVAFLLISRRSSLGLRLLLLHPPTGNEAYCRERGADEEKRSRLRHRLQVALEHDTVGVQRNLEGIEREGMREAP